MDNQYLNEAFTNLSTPLIADACVRMGVPLQFAPSGIRPVIVGSPIAGQVLPAKHYGSVDIFLEAMESARTGDVLVIDNRGRMGEGCIGDLTVLEAQASGLAGMIVWGCHRDSTELLRIGFPIFSYGTCPAGPVRLDMREEGALHFSRIGTFEVGRDEIVFADDDGACFVTGPRVEEVLATAQKIWITERRQRPFKQGTRCAHSFTLRNIYRHGKATRTILFEGICANWAVPSKNKAKVIYSPNLHFGLFLLKWGGTVVLQHRFDIKASSSHLSGQRFSFNFQEK